jgi:hypothetical protein
VRPRRGCNLQGRGLSFAEREEIALGRARGETIGGIARRLERLPSTVWRELTRNADRCDAGYRARAAHASYQRASRPKPAQPATNLRLRGWRRSVAKRSASSASSTSAWSRSSRSCDRSPAPTRASRCWSRSPGSVICWAWRSREIGDISRFLTARKLVGYSGLTPRVYQSNQKSRTAKVAKTGSTMLRWSAIEAAQQAWRATNPWHQRTATSRKRCGGKGKPG